MAIEVHTAQPEALLSAIKKAIDEKQVDTWEYDTAGDFTHSPLQWKFKAWFRPHVAAGVLRFGFLGPKGVIMTKSIYGVYHGRFVEMLLTHFDTKFTIANSTAQKVKGVDAFTAG
jgi:hypothetical protein